MKPLHPAADSPKHAHASAAAGERTHPLPKLATLAAAALLASACAVPAGPGQATDKASSEATAQAPAAPQADARAATNSPARAAVEPATDALPKVDLTPQLMFQLLASEIAAQRGEVGSAAATYLSIARQTRDPRLARRATELALVERSLDHALPAAEFWHELSPNSPIATQTIESLWISTGRLADAEPLLRARLDKARADRRRLPATQCVDGQGLGP